MWGEPIFISTHKYMKAFHRITLAAAAATALFSSCQQTTYPVFFLTESDTAEAGASFNILYNGVYYNRMPMLSLKHFQKFRSFLNNDGTYGVILYTKEEYRSRLYTQTLDNDGRKLLPVINGLAMPPMLIDGGIRDGKLVIWNGLNGYDLKMIAETVEPADPELEKKRYRDENPRKMPQIPKGAQIKRDATGRMIPQLFSENAQ